MFQVSVNDNVIDVLFHIPVSDRLSPSQIWKNGRYSSEAQMRCIFNAMCLIRDDEERVLLFWRWNSGELGWRKEFAANLSALWAESCIQKGYVILKQYMSWENFREVFPEILKILDEKIK